jgi:hypothetical protein
MFGLKVNEFMSPFGMIRNEHFTISPSTKIREQKIKIYKNML